MLQKVTGGYKGLQGVTMGVEDVTRSYRVDKALQGITRGDKRLEGVKGELKGMKRGYRWLQEVTRS